jgi:hypothetical protein
MRRIVHEAVNFAALQVLRTRVACDAKRDGQHESQDRNLPNLHHHSPVSFFPIAWQTFSPKPDHRYFP